MKKFEEKKMDPVTITQFFYTLVLQVGVLVDAVVFFGLEEGSNRPTDRKTRPNRGAKFRKELSPHSRDTEAVIPCVF